MAIQQVTSVTSTASMTGDRLSAVFSRESPLSPHVTSCAPTCMRRASSLRGVLPMEGYRNPVVTW